MDSVEEANSDTSLTILRSGVAFWNEWRAKAPAVRPVLSFADLSGMNLSDANFRGVDLSGAKLAKCELDGADLRKASLLGADVQFANLRKVIGIEHILRSRVRNMVLA